MSPPYPNSPSPKRKRRKKAVKEELKDELGDFVFDLHDLSLANIFVDSVDSSKITCIIDWESTTIRPLWHAAHLPTFLVSATNAHSHPVTPRMQSSHMSRRVSQADSRISHPDSRMSHHSDSKNPYNPSHRPIVGLGTHLPPNGAASGMASIAALTAALNNYAQGINDTSRADGFGSPRWNTFGGDISPRPHHDASPRFHSPRHRYATLGDSPRLQNIGESPQLHTPESGPRTAVLSRQHLPHANSYPIPHGRRTGPNTAVNAISGIRPGGLSRSTSHRGGDVHAHFEEAGAGSYEERRRDSGGETPRRVSREEAAEWFKEIAAEVECGENKQRCGERWTRAERERASWRVAHKAVEWDGWELGLVESVLEDARTLQGDLDF